VDARGVAAVEALERRVVPPGRPRGIRVVGARGETRGSVALGGAR
jgi:hypothetical protein